MCRLLFLGSDAELPLVAWNADAPTFHVAELRAADAPVEEHLELPFVRYAGAHEGCGCGFQLGEFPELDDPEDRLARQHSLRGLADYLEAQLSSGASLRAFSAWSDELHLSPTHRRVLTPDQLRSGSFFFLERELSTVE